MIIVDLFIFCCLAKNYSDNVNAKSTEHIPNLLLEIG